MERAAAHESALCRACRPWSRVCHYASHTFRYVGMLRTTKWSSSRIRVPLNWRSPRFHKKEYVRLIRIATRCGDDSICAYAWPRFRRGDIDGRRPVFRSTEPLIFKFAIFWPQIRVEP